MDEARVSRGYYSENCTDDLIKSKDLQIFRPKEALTSRFSPHFSCMHAAKSAKMPVSQALNSPVHLSGV
jgi:hypothetical protein